MTQTFYELLGVETDATTEEIESAYREAIKEVHPDVSDDEDAADRTARLNKAKDVLTDENERARYDRIGHEAYRSDTPSGDSSSGSSGPDASPEPGTSSGSSTGAPGDRSGWQSSGGPTGATDNGPGSSATESDPSERQRRRRRRQRRQGDPEGSDFDVDGSSSTAPGGSSVGASSVENNAGETASETTGTDRTSSQGDNFGRQATKGPWSQQGTTGTQSEANAGSKASDTTADSSWNAWDTSRAWAVHQDTGGGRGLQLSRLFPPQQSIVLVVSTFVLYPIFLATAIVPAFPLVVRLTIATCTVFMLMYLLSMPEVAILVFGGWSFLTPLALYFIPGLGVISIIGLVSLSATFIPLGFAVLTFVIVRPM